MLNPLHYLALALVLLLAVGCPAPAPQAAAPPAAAAAAATGGSCTLDLAADVSDDAAIRAVLAAEGEQVVAQDIGRLMALWAEESTVTDAKNTPDTADDDQVWNGKDAIRNRYARIVFPGAPAAVAPADLEITLDGDRAAVLATTQIGAEVSPAGDRWELVKQDGCWWIASLTYNLEGAP